MTRILADGGSTKTEWSIRNDSGEELARFTIPGLNPSLTAEKDITDSLAAAVAGHRMMREADSIEYYGAGCTPQGSIVMRRCIANVMPNARHIIVDSDIIGAAHALCGDAEGIACILGTGANSCLWDGQKIARQTPALGFILGDEGSGAVLGRLFLNALYKGRLPESVRQEFETEYSTNMHDVISHVYRMPQPNRWLASLSPFIHRHIGIPETRAIVRENFDSFLSHNILPYSRPDLPVSFVGSIACHYADILRESLDAHGLVAGRIMRSPLEQEGERTARQAE